MTQGIEGGNIQFDPGIRYDTELVQDHSMSTRIRNVAAVACLSAAAMLGPAEADGAQAQSPAIAESSSVSGNWAGYQVPTPSTINGVISEFIVPSISCPPTGSYDSSMWAGLGSGDINDPIYQTGIALACSNGMQSQRVWWEEYPINAEQDYPNPAFTLNPGDKVIEQVGVTQFGFSLVVQNFGPDPKAVNFRWTAEKDIYTSVKLPSTTECIVERPQKDGVTEALTNFGTFTSPKDPYLGFRGCNMGANGHLYSISSSNPIWRGVQRIDMKNANGDMLAETSEPSDSGAYTVTWHASN